MSGNRSNTESSFLDILFEAGFRIAVVAVGVEGFERRRVDRVRSDERFDIFHIAVVRVLGAGAGPEQPLDTSALGGQSL